MHPLDTVRRRLHEGEEVGGMPMLEGVDVTAGGESFQPVVTHRLEEPVVVGVMTIAPNSAPIR